MARTGGAWTPHRTVRQTAASEQRSKHRKRPKNKHFSMCGCHRVKDSRAAALHIHLRGAVQTTFKSSAYESVWVNMWVKELAERRCTMLITDFPWEAALTVVCTGYFDTHWKLFTAWKTVNTFLNVFFSAWFGWWSRDFCICDGSKAVRIQATDKNVLKSAAGCTILIYNVERRMKGSLNLLDKTFGKGEAQLGRRSGETSIVEGTEHICYG